MPQTESEQSAKIVKIEKKLDDEQLTLSPVEQKELGSTAVAQEVEAPEVPVIEYVESVPELERSERENARIAVEDYLLATQFLSEIDSRAVTDYLEMAEMKGLSDVDGFIERRARKDPATKLLPGDVLRIVFKNVIERRDSLTPPKRPVDRSQVSQIRRDLKTNYVLGLGERLKSYIDAGEVKNIGKAKGKIRALFDGAYLRQRKPLESVGRYSDNEFRQSKIQEIENLFNGMRHELAFEEMIYEGNADEADSLFEIEDTGRTEELQGIDMRLLAKVFLGADGKYHFPSTAEEFARCDSQAKINLDIKASEKAVAESLKRRQQAGYDDTPGQSLIMWSHVYNDDFRLDLVDGRPSLEYGPDEALLYLSVGSNNDGQLSIMRRLDEAPGLTYRIPEKAPFHPENFNTRYQNIKKQLLDYINTNQGVVGLIDPNSPAVA